MKGERLGEFEELTLLAVKAIEAPVYGVPVQQYVERQTHRAVTMGAIYAALERLERKGFVRSEMSDPVAARGGKSRRLYAVTPAGMQTLRDIRRVRDRIWRAIEEG
jgi:PadR family transcriptional regulator, regulatory protein PadR